MLALMHDALRYQPSTTARTKLRVNALVVINWFQDFLRSKPAGCEMNEEEDCHCLSLGFG